MHLWTDLSLTLVEGSTLPSGIWYPRLPTLFDESMILFMPLCFYHWYYSLMAFQALRLAWQHGWWSNTRRPVESEYWGTFGKRTCIFSLFYVLKCKTGFWNKICIWARIANFRFKVDLISKPPSVWVLKMPQNSIKWWFLRWCPRPRFYC